MISRSGAVGPDDKSFTGLGSGPYGRLQMRHYFGGDAKGGTDNSLLVVEPCERSHLRAQRLHRAISCYHPL